MTPAILVIEDEKDHQFLILRRLTRRGYSDVEIVASLADGVRACEEKRRDVLIVDSGVVGENRDEAARRLREICPGARLIGYSAGPNKHPWADAHIAKGDSFDEVLAEIARSRS